jgi:hypothetical protein
MAKRKSNLATNTNFVTCSRHHGRKIEACIVCIHLLEFKSREWIPLKYSDSDIPDWYCPECYRRYEQIVANMEYHLVRPCCVECIDAVRFLSDKNYRKETNGTSKRKVSNQRKPAAKNR